MKSICIKCNNKSIQDFLLNGLNTYSTTGIKLSKKEFKYYTNIIIHILDNQDISSIYELSHILSIAVVKFYEEKLIHVLLNSNYFYFNKNEKTQVTKTCQNILTESKNEYSIENRESILTHIFFQYLLQNKALYLDGFVFFRLHDYIDFLNFIIDISVNKFIIEREYSEFISLLKLYINSQNYKSEIVHLIYKDKNSILLDKNKDILNLNNSISDRIFLSDISFSSNDYVLNTLLDLLPEKLIVHLIDEKDEFINTLELIFGNNLHICTNCNICNIYKKKESITN